LNSKKVAQVELTPTEAGAQASPTEPEQFIEFGLGRRHQVLRPWRPSEQEAPAEIEQVIEQIGTRYIADLRTLNECFIRFYEARLVAKDEELAELRRRIEAIESERDAREAELRDLRRVSARYIADLRTLGEELSRRVELNESEDTSS
jgi:hypothetical protein